MDVACVVQNAGTAAAIAAAVIEGKPLIDRIVTVTGSPLVSPGNFRLKIGTPVSDAIKFAGGVKFPPAKLIMGGLMMGLSQKSFGAPVMKSTSGIVLLGPDEIFQYSSEPCIRCGRCVKVCPMRLMPGPRERRRRMRRLRYRGGLSYLRLHGVRLLRVCLPGQKAACPAVQAGKSRGPRRKAGKSRKT